MILKAVMDTNRCLGNIESSNNKSSNGLYQDTGCNLLKYVRNRLKPTPVCYWLDYPSRQSTTFDDNIIV